MMVLGAGQLETPESPSEQVQVTNTFALFQPEGLGKSQITRRDNFFVEIEVGELAAGRFLGKQFSSQTTEF